MPSSGGDHRVALRDRKRLRGDAVDRLVVVPAVLMRGNFDDCHLHAPFFCKGSSASPDEIFAEIPGLIQHVKDAEVKIEEGNYVGAGAGTITLNFSAKPFLVFVSGMFSENSNYTSYTDGIFIGGACGVTFRAEEGTRRFQLENVTWENTSMSFATTNWLNGNGKTFHYVAICKAVDNVFDN